MHAPLGLSASALLLVACACALPSAAAADAESSELSRAHADHIVLGMKGVNTIERAVVDGHAVTLSGYGFAGMAETTFLHGRLALELDLVFTSPGSELSMAGEPMIKLPWHLTEWLEPYVAAGPMVLRVHHGLGHSERSWLGGGQLVLGAFVWFAAMAGIDVDVAIGAAHGPEMSITELTVAIGPVLRN